MANETLEIMEAFLTDCISITAAKTDDVSMASIDKYTRQNAEAMFCKAGAKKNEAAILADCLSIGIMAVVAKKFAELQET